MHFLTDNGGSSWLSSLKPYAPSWPGSNWWLKRTTRNQMDWYIDSIWLYSPGCSTVWWGISKTGTFLCGRWNMCIAPDHIFLRMWWVSARFYRGILLVRGHLAQKATHWCNFNYILHTSQPLFLDRLETMLQYELIKIKTVQHRYKGYYDKTICNVALLIIYELYVCIQPQLITSSAAKRLTTES